VSSALMIHPLSESHIANSFQLFWTRGIPSSSGNENAINFRIGRDILTLRPNSGCRLLGAEDGSPFLGMSRRRNSKKRPNKNPKQV
jgi:hypothetical protein